MRRIGMAVLGLTVVTSPLMAQRSALREVHRGGNGSFGAALVVAEPLGEFSRNGDVAAGLSIFGVTSGGLLALRVEGAWMAYDVSYQGYGVSTTSQIGTLGAGPQLTLGTGALRFYGFATMGGSLFWSNASYNSCGCYRTASHDAGGHACVSDRGVDRDSVTSPAVPDFTPRPPFSVSERGLLLFVLTP